MKESKDKMKAKEDKMKAKKDQKVGRGALRKKYERGAPTSLKVSVYGSKHHSSCCSLLFQMYA